MTRLIVLAVLCLWCDALALAATVAAYVVARDWWRSRVRHDRIDSPADLYAAGYVVVCEGRPMGQCPDGIDPELTLAAATRQVRYECVMWDQLDAGVGVKGVN